MKLIRQLIGVYLVLVGLAVAIHFVATQFYDPTITGDSLDVWLVLDVLMAISLVLVLATAIRRKQMLRDGDGGDRVTREYLEAKAVDLYQADTIWAGGVSEMMKIFALCSAYGVPLIPHGGSVPINAHLTAAVSPTDAPYIEYLVQWNEFTQFFWKNPTKPVNGYISPTDDPGLGLEIDEEKVISRQRLDY